MFISEGLWTNQDLGWKLTTFIRNTGYDLKQKKQLESIVIFAISHFRSPTPTTFWKSVFVSLFSMVYTPPSPTYIFL